MADYRTFSVGFIDGEVKPTETATVNKACLSGSHTLLIR
jgi:hypothetical protein